MVWAVYVTGILVLGGIGLKEQQGREWPLHVHRQGGVIASGPAG